MWGFGGLWGIFYGPKVHCKNLRSQDITAPIREYGQYNPLKLSNNEKDLSLHGFLVLPSK